METKGWIKIHRKITDNAFCRGNSERTGFWVILLTMANHTPATFFVGAQKVSLESGQFVTGRKELSKLTGVSEMKCERWLSCLENEQQIAQQKTSKFRVITVKNWNKFQLDEQQNAQQMNNKRTTDEQQMNTNKNVKNVRMKEKYSYTESGNQMVTQVKLSKDNTTVAEATGVIELNNEIHPMSELEEPTYVSETKPKKKSKHGSKTMAVLAYAYAKASGADLTKTINGSAWIKPLSEIYEYFDKDADAAVKYITDSVNYYESITMRDGSKCKYSVRTIQNVADVLRLMDEAPKSNKSDIFF